MASNTFKASQLIAHLKLLMDFHGDLDVVLPIAAADRTFAITEQDVAAANTQAGLVIAIAPKDPAQDYQREPGGQARDGWNYDLATAPVTVDEAAPVIVKVYKRFGGADTGYFFDGFWHVYEGGSRAWKCAQGGVLAWSALA